MITKKQDLKWHYFNRSCEWINTVENLFNECKMYIYPYLYLQSGIKITCSEKKATDCKVAIKN